MKRVIKMPGSGGGSNGLMFNILCLFISFFLVTGLIFAAESAYGQDNIESNQLIVDIGEGDDWHYFKGLQGPPDGWYRYDFDTSTWQRGPTGIGYGIGSNRTFLGDMEGNYTTLYARKEFTITDHLSVVGINLSVACDGPFIAYLNGVEMIRTNTIQSLAPVVSTGMLQVERYNLSGFVHELIPDRNILALKCENDDIHSKDFSFIPVFEILEKGGAQ